MCYLTTHFISIKNWFIILYFVSLNIIPRIYGKYCWELCILIVEVVTTSTKTLHLVFLVFLSAEAIDRI